MNVAQGSATMATAPNATHVGIAMVATGTTNTSVRKTKATVEGGERDDWNSHASRGTAMPWDADSHRAVDGLGHRPREVKRGGINETTET